MHLRPWWKQMSTDVGYMQFLIRQTLDAILGHNWQNFRWQILTGAQWVHCYDTPAFSDHKSNGLVITSPCHMQLTMLHFCARRMLVESLDVIQLNVIFSIYVSCGHLLPTTGLPNISNTSTWHNYYSGRFQCSDWIWPPWLWVRHW